MWILRIRDGLVQQFSKAGRDLFAGAPRGRFLRLWQGVWEGRAVFKMIT